MKQIKEYTLVLGLVFSVAFIFSFIQSQSKPIIMDFNIMMITTLPIVTLFYRYGCYPTIIVGTIYGVGVGIMAFWAHGDVGLMLTYVLFGVSLSINGLFAKNVHKTLNNKRLNSVWLNVITASVLISLLMIGLTVFNIRYFNVANALYYGSLNVIAMMLVAYAKPEWILTKRSRFLSRKERSKLLND